MRFIILLVSLTVGFSQGSWKIDASHSSVGFSVTHMVISETEGKFETFSGTVKTTSDDFENAKISVTIDPATINTGDNRRDKHLKNPDFFDVEKFKEMTFTSTSMKKTGDKTYVLKGNLMMHGVTKPVELNVDYRGTVKDPWGNTRAGFRAEGKLDRYEWGLKYGGVMEAGGLVIGQHVTLTINLELIKNK